MIEVETDKGSFWWRDILKLLDCFKYISPLFKFKMARPASSGKTIRSNNP
jgi:hypothetical protein